MLSISSTVGIWLVTAFLEAIYFTWYHKDPWFFKATVALLLTLEWVQMGASIGVYEWLITGFGDLVHWHFASLRICPLQYSFVSHYDTQREIAHNPKLLLVALIPDSAREAQVRVSERSVHEIRVGLSTRSS
ncbi:hypothetical protein GGX14DRAFT_385563 [Mycena pura]|uniref:Uncharacterized protein n=1 Tax=Mycena pura TaxID=153505 RepID=A0AAD6YQW1_9AGAR|nr:hypothetical protein GGX14DRAFT_385563 [Mycena pura]